MTAMLLVKDVAARLRLSPAKVYELIEGRKLEHFRFGGAIRVSEAQLQAFIQGCLVAGRGEQPKVARPKLKHLKLSASPHRVAASD